MVGEGKGVVYRLSGTSLRGAHVNVWRIKAALIMKDIRWMFWRDCGIMQWRNFEISVGSLARLGIAQTLDSPFTTNLGTR